MAINVSHGPSMVDYGMAVAKAAEMQQAAQRAQQYGQYLAGVQSSNQQYGLGLGNLGVAQQNSDTNVDRTALASRELDQSEFRNNLALQELNYNIQRGSDSTAIDRLNARSNSNQSYAGILNSMSRFGYS